MAIPDFQSLMLPLLRYCEDGKDHTTSEVINALAADYNLTEEERKTRGSSGQQAVFDNRVAWAKSRLKTAGLLESPKRGVHKITPSGLDILRQNPPLINIKFLSKIPEYVNNRKRPKAGITNETQNNQEKTPEEIIESASAEIRENLALKLLEEIKKCSPNFFENLVVALIVKMGYGGSRQDAGKAIGRSGDGGIDGIIKEDRLGLDAVYIQAKRWENTVGRPEIQKFVGALQGQKARKGLFITTSEFTKEAADYVSRINNKIVLIDGEQLAELMIDYNVGVSTVTIYELKKIDYDYFTEE